MDWSIQIVMSSRITVILISAPTTQTNWQYQLLTNKKLQTPFCKFIYIYTFSLIHMDKQKSIHDHCLHLRADLWWSGVRGWGQVTECLMPDCLTTITLDPGLSSGRRVSTKKSYLCLVFRQVMSNKTPCTLHKYKFYNHPVHVRIKSALRILWWWSYLDKCLTSR